MCGDVLSAVTDATNDTQAEQIFDNIEYRKGGSILRMLWNYMGSEEYRSTHFPPIMGPGHAANVSCPHLT